MDNISELIETKKFIIVSKQMTKEMRDEKKKAWGKIRNVLRVKTGKEFTEAQMIKKWNNIQSHVKEADLLCCKINANTWGFTILHRALDHKTEKHVPKKGRRLVAKGS